MTSLENDPRLWDRINRMPIEERERLLGQIRPRIIDPYVPHVPHPTQQVFLSLTSEREVFFGGAAGGGKDLHVKQILFTTSGWKTQGTVEVGDFVLDHNSEPTLVVAVGHVEHNPCYALTWSTGETVIAGERHLWPVDDDVVETAEIFRRWSAGEKIANERVILESIEATPSVPTRCIQVRNPRGIYLVGDTLIPTHNSDAILMAALQYVDVPGYAALILRKTFKDLTLPGAIMDRANDWLMNTPARKRNGGQYWEFPTGPGRKPATLSFGHLMYHSSTEQYRGAELTFIAVDELTQFEERTYDFMFSRLRRPALPCENCPRQVEQNPEEERGVWRHKELAPGTRVRSCDYPKPNRTAVDEYPASNIDGMTTLFDVPLRMRTSSNPGGVGFSWVRDRFVDPRTRKPGARFVPSKLTDNPSLDQESYRESLSRMGRKTRLQLEEGLWDVVDENAMLPRHHFPAVEDWPKDKTQYVRFWDFAATAPAPGKTPDWTVGALLALTSDGVWYLVDLRRVQATPAEVERLVMATAQQDVQRVGGVIGRVKVVVEQEPGSSGVQTVATYRRLLAGYPFTGDRPSGSKEERARPLAVAAENGNFKILTAPWNRPFLDECEAFPYGPHDDQVDAVTGAMKMLVPARGKARLLA